MTIALQVQREPDQVAVIDEAVVYGLAVTLAMPGEVRLYDEVRARIAPPIRAGGSLTLPSDRPPKRCDDFTSTTDFSNALKSPPRLKACRFERTICCTFQ